MGEGSTSHAFVNSASTVDQDWGTYKGQRHLSFGLWVLSHMDKFGIGKMIPGRAPRWLAVQDLNKPSWKLPWYLIMCPQESPGDNPFLGCLHWDPTSEGSHLMLQRETQLMKVLRTQAFLYPSWGIWWGKSHLQIPPKDAKSPLNYWSEQGYFNDFHCGWNQKNPSST